MLKKETVGFSENLNIIEVDTSLFKQIGHNRILQNIQSSFERFEFPYVKTNKIYRFISCSTN